MIPDPRGETPKEVPMNAMQLLKQEHEHAKQMFAQIRAASGEQRGHLWTRLKPELKVHEQMEELEEAGRQMEGMKRQNMQQAA